MATPTDEPSLTLSDIVHSLSPSPAPADAEPVPTALPQATVGTPEPVYLEDVTGMRERVEELLSFNGFSDQKLLAREKELVDMVLRLTNSTFPDPAQLLAQAEIISQLQQQRDMLLVRAEEDHARWEAERENWDRMAEALIARQAKESAAAANGSGSTREEEYERQTATLDSDNKTLRQKLAESQSRLSALESELAQLRPVLLMQPFALTHSHSDASRARRKQKKDALASLAGPSGIVHDEQQEVDELTNDIENGDSAVQRQEQQHQQNQQENKSKGDYYRKREPIIPGFASPSVPTKKGHGDGGTHRRSSSSKHGPSAAMPLLSDARSEHLLLAARKIGRNRASIMASMLYKPPPSKDKDREKGKEKEKAHEQVGGKEGMLVLPGLNPPTTPKTPRRVIPAVPPAMATPPPAMHPHARYVYPPYMYGHPPGYIPLAPLLSPIGHRHPSVTIPPGPPFGHPRTPRGAAASSPPLKPKGKVTMNANGNANANPPTPLDSLLSAARSMLSPDQSDRRQQSSSRSHPRPSSPDYLETPVPKRRRMNVSQHAKKQGDGAGTGTRVMSALDVLADQAAVFSSKSDGRSQRSATLPPESEDHPSELRNSHGTRNKGKGKGKGKERARSPPKRSPTPAPEAEMSRSQTVSPTPHPTVGPLHSPSPLTSPPLAHPPVSLPPPPPPPPPPLLARTPLHPPFNPPRDVLFSDNRSVRQRSPSPMDVTPSGNPLPSSPSSIPAATPSLFSPVTSTSISSAAGVLPMHDSLAPLPLPSSTLRHEEAETPLISTPLLTVLPTPPLAPLKSLSSSMPNNDIAMEPLGPSGEANPLLYGSFHQFRVNTQSAVSIDTTPQTEAANFPPRVDDMRSVGTADIDGNAVAAESTLALDPGSSQTTIPEISELARVAVQDASGRRQRSPYVKWTKEEDDLLAQAVAKYGQKWDEVQKAVPSRGYHQVRQRWLRKLGVFDNKPDLSSLQTAVLFPSAFASSHRDNGQAVPTPKLGLAPLSSEMTFGNQPVSGSTPGSSRVSEDS